MSARRSLWSDRHGAGTGLTQWANSVPRRSGYPGSGKAGRSAELLLAHHKIHITESLLQFKPELTVRQNPGGPHADHLRA